MKVKIIMDFRAEAYDELKDLCLHLEKYCRNQARKTKYYDDEARSEFLKSATRLKKRANFFEYLKAQEIKENETE